MGKKELTKELLEQVVKETVGYTVLVNRLRTIPKVTYNQWDMHNDWRGEMTLDFGKDYSLIIMTFYWENNSGFEVIAFNMAENLTYVAKEELKKAISSMEEEVQTRLNREFKI